MEHWRFDRIDYFGRLILLLGTGLKNKLRNGVARMSKLVIGAGRSGIAAASFLARQGFFVTLSDLKCPADFFRVS